MNSKERPKIDHEDIKKEIKKTAIVKPTIRPKQKSFNGFTHGSARIKNEESFSSLPNQIQSKIKRGNTSRKINIISHDQKCNTKSKYRINKSDIQKDELEEEIENDIGLEELVLDKENNRVSLEDLKLRRTQDVIPNPRVLTKPLLDVIDDLCSGASSNCDRKKLSQEKRRKSLSQERIIGIKQFFKYSKLWRDIKGL